MADINFIPAQSSFKIRMNFDVNGEQYEIFSFEKQTNFNIIISQIKILIWTIYNLLYEDSKTVQPIFNEFQSNITNSLTQFYNEIKILPQLKTEEFKYELERILLKVN